MLQESEAIEYLFSKREFQDSDCMICNAKPSSCFFEPCLNGGICWECAQLVVKSKDKRECPICRKDVDKMVKYTTNEDNTLKVLQVFDVLNQKAVY